MSKKKNFIYKIKVCLYWTSVVMPIYDVIVGTVSAIKNLVKEAKDQRDEKLREEKYQQQYERFLNDN